MRGAGPIRLSTGDHVVHFYDTEPELIGLVASYLTTSVLDGDSVLAIATTEHLEALEAAMATAHLDVSALRAAHRLVLLDAGAALSSFMAAGGPDPAAFDSAVGSQVRRAAARGRPVKAYGEMVALLWARGDTAGAVELERLWDNLAARNPMALFCAYPTSLMAPVEVEEGFGEVCRLHSAVVAGAPIPATAESSRRFVASPHAARRARLFVSRTLAEWGLRAERDDVLIAVAELAANAVTHAGTDFSVSLTRSGDRLRLDVGDTEAVPVAELDYLDSAEGGRGLSMVAAVADEWGYDMSGGGKVVWAEFRSSARAEAEG